MHAVKSKVQETYRQRPRDRPSLGCGRNRFRTTLLRRWKDVQRPSSCQRTSNLHRVDESAHVLPTRFNPAVHSPVGTSNTSKPFSLATKSIAPLVGILLARPLIPPLALLK